MCWTRKEKNDRGGFAVAVCVTGVGKEADGPFALGTFTDCEGRKGIPVGDGVELALARVAASVAGAAGGLAMFSGN